MMGRVPFMMAVILLGGTCSAFAKALADLEQDGRLQIQDGVAAPGLVAEENHLDNQL